MRGKVLSYDSASKAGVISADDGQRYNFTQSDLQGGSKSIGSGHEVDFVVSGGSATDIFPIIGQLGSGDKNKIVAALLAFFLGGLGIHKFYLGKTTAGFVMLLVFLFGFILFGIPSAIIAIIAFIEFIIYLIKDEQTFRNDYVDGKKAWF